MRKLHLGCGKALQEGWINIDRCDFGQEIVRDITRGLPFDDDSVDEIYSHHALEHIRQGEDVEFVLLEIWRVLKVGGTFSCVVPHVAGRWAWHSGHVSYWHEETIQCMPDGGWPFAIVECNVHGADCKELYFTLRKTEGKPRFNF
jgi:predicted SAM-dependent methyltransferase